MIKFMKHYVKDTETGEKCAVFYSAYKRISDNKKCVRISAKKYDGILSMFKNVQNDSDPMTDYFDKDSVTIFENDPLYAQAYARATA